MATPEIFKLPFESLGEPDDLWGRFFLAAIQHLGEYHRAGFMRLDALEKCVLAMRTEMEAAGVGKSERLAEAMALLDEALEVKKMQSSTSLDQAEKLGAMAMMLAERNQGG